MVLNQVMLKKLIYRYTVVRVFMCRCANGSTFLSFFSKGEDELGQIYMQHKVEACFGVQSVAWVGSCCFLIKKGCGKSDDIVDDDNSLTLVGVAIMHYVLPKTTLCLMKDRYLHCSFRRVEFWSY